MVKRQRGKEPEQKRKGAPGDRRAGVRGRGRHSWPWPRAPGSLKDSGPQGQAGVGAALLG